MLSNFKRSAGTALVALATTLPATGAMAAWNELNLPKGVTPISREVYDLHMLMLWICVIIGILVFGAMFIAIVKHQKAAGHQPAHFHHSTLAEIAWTIVPFAILVGFAIPATKTLLFMEDTSGAEVTVKVTGYQWLWKYEYVEDGVSFYSSLAESSRQGIYGDPWEVENYLLEVDNPVVLPIKKKVRLLLTADDVIHAWWVPAFGMKKDAIPGFVNEIWVYIEEAGTYRGQCAELCGKDHGFMPIVVEAKSEAEYKQWVAAYKAEQKTQLAAASQ